jgi:hypothetical protein
MEELEQSLERGDALRIVLGDRESRGTQQIDRQRHQLGRVVAAPGVALALAVRAPASG